MKIQLIFIGLVLASLGLGFAAIVESDSQSQLDIMHTCYVEYSEADFSKYCRNELDGFGHMVDLQGTARQLAALERL